MQLFSIDQHIMLTKKKKKIKTDTQYKHPKSSPKEFIII